MTLAKMSVCFRFQYKAVDLNDTLNLKIVDNDTTFNLIKQNK